jgi:glyoxylase-like metal-dependent hydrolase (beta-lactamase superfamily II)
MTVRLIDNLYVISGDKLTHPWDASAYLLAGDEPTLIDCGSSEGYPALKRNLRQLGYKPGDIRRVIATHGHWDHVSAMNLLREESDAELFLHQAECQQVETGDWDGTAAFLYGSAFPPVKVNRFLKDGDVLTIGEHRLHVYHTPGHSPGSVSLWMEMNGFKILIAGDTLWGGFHPRIRSNIDDWTASLDRLLELEFDVMTTGHCPPTLIFDAKTKVREARQQLGVLFDPWFKPFNVKFMYRGL